jgi:recombinational DNA repair ATPase RecF
MYTAIQWPSIAITSLTIRDFRGIASLDLDFRGPDGRPNSLVVLAGPNGCGKTAVLEAALFLVGGNELLVGQQDEPAIRRGAKNYSIQATIKSGEYGFTGRHEWSRPVHPLPNLYPIGTFRHGEPPSSLGRLM